jgi:hypothetical protein
MEIRSRDVFAQQQRQRDFNCYYPSQLLENSACANYAFKTPSPSKNPVFLTTSQKDTDEKELIRAIRFLKKYYPNCADYQLIDVLEECNLDEDKALDMLEKRYDSFIGHEQQSMQRWQQIERSDQNSASYQGASGQHSSMQTFLG